LGRRPGGGTPQAPLHLGGSTFTRWRSGQPPASSHRAPPFRVSRSLRGNQGSPVGHKRKTCGNRGSRQGKPQENGLDKENHMRDIRGSRSSARPLPAGCNPTGGAEARRRSQSPRSSIGLALLQSCLPGYEKSQRPRLPISPCRWLPTGLLDSFAETASLLTHTIVIRGITPGQALNPKELFRPFLCRNRGCTRSRGQKGVSVQSPISEQSEPR
jgi:hypothetical protein